MATTSASTSRRCAMRLPSTRGCSCARPSSTASRPQRLISPPPALVGSLPRLLPIAVCLLRLAPSGSSPLTVAPCGACSSGARMCLTGRTKPCSQAPNRVRPLWTAARCSLAQSPTPVPLVGPCTLRMLGVGCGGQLHASCVS
ncbi:hypothetical protein T484DRAFT_2149549 [Baffinella frigidus]|nr:hypothetical protein T484DRAFT_2149549 [Cryptophyta sp. CCMP2293]